MKLRTVLLFSAAALLPTMPALAGWKLVDADEPIKVAKSEMTVVPVSPWNRETRRPTKDSEVWTLDGLGLNEIYFVGDLAPGEPLFREADKKNNPLPKFRSDLLLPEIVDLFESSARTYLSTSLFNIENVAPAKMGSHDAVQFSYNYAMQGNDLLSKGLGRAAIIDGRLYLVNFTAPAIYYFDRDQAQVEAIFDSIYF